MTHVHLIGIGGSGLSAIASLLLERGEVVSGSDRQMTPAAQAIQAAGAKVTIGHWPENIIGADLVVRSSAIPDTNPEVQAAQAAGIPVFKRDGFLGTLLQGYRVIAVAGTHGKDHHDGHDCLGIDQAGRRSFIHYWQHCYQPGWQRPCRKK